METGDGGRFYPKSVADRLQNNPLVGGNKSYTFGENIRGPGDGRGQRVCGDYECWLLCESILCVNLYFA